MPSDTENRIYCAGGCGESVALSAMWARYVCSSRCLAAAARDERHEVAPICLRCDETLTVEEIDKAFSLRVHGPDLPEQNGLLCVLCGHSFAEFIDGTPLITAIEDTKS